MVPYFRYSEATWKKTYNDYLDLSKNDSPLKGMKTLEEFKNMIFCATQKDFEDLNKVYTQNNKYSVIIKDCLINEPSDDIRDLDPHFPQDLYTQARDFYLSVTDFRHTFLKHDEKPIIKKLREIEAVGIPGCGYENFEIYMKNVQRVYLANKKTLDASFPELKNNLVQTSNHFALKALAALIGLMGLALMGLVIAAAVFSAGPLVIITTTLTSTVAATAAFVSLGIMGTLMAAPMVAVGLYSLFKYAADALPGSSVPRPT